MTLSNYLRLLSLRQKFCLITSKARNHTPKIIAKYVEIKKYVYKMILEIDLVHL